jgi:hypothetical protein
MIICHSRKFIFIHIHKTGGTSMERALDPYLEWNDLIVGSSPLGESIQGPFAHKFGLNKHSGVADIERVCGSRYINEYYTFSLVRHPVSRLCSMYNFVATILTKWARNREIPLDKVEAHITPQVLKKKPGLGWASSRVYLSTRNFSEFIRHDELRREPGYRLQVSSLVGLRERVVRAHVFRLEDRASWLDTLAARLGTTPDFPHENESELKLIDPDSVSPEDRAYIASEFREDYDVLGYR